jgi:hypothetical protein
MRATDILTGSALAALLLFALWCWLSSEPTTVDDPTDPHAVEIL